MYATGIDLGQTYQNTSHTYKPSYFPILWRCCQCQCKALLRNGPAMLPLHTRMSHNLQAHAPKLVPAPICTIFSVYGHYFSRSHQDSLQLQGLNTQ